MILKVNFAALLRPVQQEFALNVLAQVPWVIGEVINYDWLTVLTNGILWAATFTGLNYLTIRQVRRMVNERHAFLAQQMGVMVAEHMQRYGGRIDGISNRMVSLCDDMAALKMCDYGNVDAVVADALSGSAVNQRQITLDKEIAVLCSEHAHYTKRAKSIEERHVVLERYAQESAQLAREANREAARCAGGLAQVNDLLAKQKKERSRKKKAKD